MSTFCVNINSPEFIALQKETNLVPAILQAKVSSWMDTNGSDNFPTAEQLGINQSLRAIQTLMTPSNKTIQNFNILTKGNITIEQFVDRAQIPAEQKQLVIDSWKNGNTTMESIVADIAANYSYTVEVNTTKTNKPVKEKIYTIDNYNYLGRDENGGMYIVEQAPYGDNFEYIGEERAKKIMGEELYNKLALTENFANTEYYSNLTVPGGTNYTENEIAIPGQLVEEKPQGVPVKQGVSELFESNPELANTVYEALGFKLKTSENEITRGIKEVLPYKVIGDYSNIEEGLIGRKQYETKIGDDTYVFEISNYNYENEDGTYQSYYDIDFTVNGSEELVGTGFFDKSEKAKQIIQAIISQNFGNDTIRFNVEESKKGKQRLLLYKRLMSQLGYNPSDEMEYALFYNANTYISPSDKIIFGHPTIGKSFLKKQGENKFITLDDDYANEVNAFVDANRGSETRQEYKGRKPKEYNEFMLNLYDRLKVQAKKEGKILFISNTNILKERMSDFDRVITIPKDEFKKRFDARGATYGFEDWKSDIDATVAKVPSNKVISTTGYLSDLFEFSRKINLTPQQKQQAQQLYSQYLAIIFPDSKVKDIVYHGTRGYNKITGEELPKFEKFDKIFIGKGQGLRSDDMAKGFYFGSYKIANRVGTRIIPAILNIKEENNTTVRRNTEDFDTKGDVFVVFEPEQIHILGSKQDIEGFEKFIKDNTKTVRKGAITPSIKGHAQFSTENGNEWYQVEVIPARDQQPIFFNKIVDPKTFEERVISYLQGKRLINEKQETHDGQKYNVVRRYLEGSYDPYTGKGEYVMYDNIHALNNIRNQYRDRNGYYPFDLKQLANNRVAVIVNEQASMFNKQDNSDYLATAVFHDLAARLSQKTGVKFETINEEEALRLLPEDSYNGEPAFFYNDKVYFIEGRLTKENALHEFAHPFVLSLKKDNPTLYASLIANIKTSQDPRLQSIAKFVQANYEEKYQSDELLVRAMAEVGDKMVDTSSKNVLKALVDRFLFYIKQLFRSVFGQKVNLDSLSFDTTIEDLSKILYDDNIQFDTSENVADYVLFNKPMAEEFAKMEQDKVVKNIQNFHDVLLTTLHRLRRSDYKQLADALAKEGDSNYFKSAQQLTEAAQQLEDDITKQSIGLQNFAQAVMNIRIASEKMKEHVDVVAKNPDVKEQDKLAMLVNYMYIVSDWEQVFDELRKDNPGDLPLLADEISRTTNNFKRIHDFRDSIFKTGLVSVLRDQMAPIKAAADAYFPAQIEAFQKAVDAGEKGLTKKLEDYKLMYKRFSYDDAAILDFLSGKMGDTNMFSAMLESYSSSPDPIVGSFATFLNKNLYEVESYIFKYKTDLTAELDPYYKSLGINRSNPEQLSVMVTSEDVIPINKEGEAEGFKVKTIINPYSNGWLFDYVSKEMAIKKAVQEKDFIKAGELKKEFEDFKAKYFNREYKDEVYEAKNYWHSSPIAQMAYQKRKEIIDQLRAIDQWAELNPEDIENKDRLEKELHTLGSLRNLDGTEKTGDELDIANAIQEYYKRNKGIYEETEIKGAFNRALEQFKIELEEQSILPRTPEYKTRLNNWIKSNIRYQNSELFYNSRQALIDEVDSIIKKLPNDEASKLQISELWKRIIEQVKGFRDQNGQPIGTELSDEKLAYIKKDQEQIEDIKRTLRKLSGLTIQQQDRLSELYSMMTSGLVLTASEQDEFEELNSIKNEFGLSEADKTRLLALFEEMQNLSGKIPTEYYVDTINEKLIQSGIKLKIDLNNIDNVLMKDYINPIMEEHPEFKKWFLANHIEKLKWDKESKSNVSVYERLYTWSRIIPNEPELRALLNSNDYEKLLEYSSPNVTIKKGRKYHFYRIRNDLRTERIVGENVDNRGHWLPKNKEQLAGGDENYLNKEYYRLRDSSAQRDKDIFKVAQIFAKYHLKSQENTPVKNRLYLEVPRMRKERLEVVNSTLSTPGQSLSNAMDWVKSKVNPHKLSDDFDTGQANKVDDSKMYVMTDLFGNQVTTIPVRYMSRLDVDMTTYDIGKAIVSYAASVRTSKQLHDINPIAKALVSVLEENGIQDINKMSKSNLYNKMMNIGVKDKANVRLKAIKNLIERDFEGIESKLELGVFANRVAQHISGIAAFGSMAVNIPGHLKNMFSARIQSIMEAAIGANFDGKSWLEASSEFTFKWIPQMVSDYNKFANKTLASQIVEAFDPVQGKFMERLGHEFAGSVKKDLIDFKFPTAGQAFGEMEAQGSALLAMMKFTRVPVNKFNGTTELVSYDKVWALKDGKLALIDGVDQEWNIGGAKFIEFKARMHKVNELLQGAYAKMNQPELSRYTTGRLALFMRRFFVPGFVNRFATMRPNFALGTFREGNYVTFVKTVRDFTRTGLKTWGYMTVMEKRMFMKTLIELGYSMGFLALLSLLGYSDSDKKRFKKLKANSWAENMLIYEVLLTKGEAETYIPIPGMGVNELLKIKDSPSLAFPLINKYYKIFSHFADLIADPFTSEDLSHYDKKTGIYEKGDLKLKADLLKLIGFTGSSTSDAGTINAIKNYSQTMNRYR